MQGVPLEQVSPAEPNPICPALQCSWPGPEAKGAGGFSCWEPNFCSGAARDSAAVALPVHPGAGCPQAGTELVREE